MTRLTRDALLLDLHRWLHGYLSEAAVHTDLPTMVDELWSLPADFRKRLLAAQVLSSDRTLAAIDAAAAVVRTLPPSAIRRESESRGVVLGQVLWQRTFERRVATSDPTVFVTRPTHRSFDTPATRFIRFCMAKLLTLNAVFPVEPDTGGVSERIRQVAARCRELQENPKISGGKELNRIDAKMRDALVKRDPRLGQLEEVLRGVEDALAGGSVETLVPALIGTVFAPGSDATLFELWVGLRIIEVLRSLGAGVIAGPWDTALKTNAFAQITYGESQFTMLWQRSYWQLPVFRDGGLYRQVLQKNGLDSSSLRPDFIFYRSGPRPRVALIEVKFTSREDHSPDRAGIIDCLAYLRDIDQCSVGADINCLVVANQTSATPVNDLICVAGPEDLNSAAVINQLIGRPAG